MKKITILSIILLELISAGSIYSMDRGFGNQANFSAYTNNFGSYNLDPFDNSSFSPSAPPMEQNNADYHTFNGQIDTGAGLNLYDDSLNIGTTELIRAVQTDRVDAVRDCLSYRRNLINIFDNNGRSPIYYAIRNNNFEICELLVDAGANLTATYEDDNISILNVALLQDGINLQIIELIVNRNHRLLLTKDKDDNTPIRIAELINRNDIYRFFTNYTPNQRRKLKPNINNLNINLNTSLNSSKSDINLPNFNSDSNPDLNLGLNINNAQDDTQKSDNLHSSNQATNTGIINSFLRNNPLKSLLVGSGLAFGFWKAYNYYYLDKQEDKESEKQNQNNHMPYYFDILNNSKQS